MRAIRYKIERPSGLSEYVFDFLFEIIGIAGQSIDNDVSEVDIYYGNSSLVQGAKIRIKENRNDLIRDDLVQGKISSEDFAGTIEFDIIHAIGAFLTDDVHATMPPEAYDTHDRLRFSESFQAQNHIEAFPVVNRYLQFFRDQLAHHFSLNYEPLWPHGKKFAIGLSHDTDWPDKYALLKAPPLCKNGSLQENVLMNLERMAYTFKWLFDKGRNEYWLFDQIMHTEEKFGFRSTFFVASVNKFTLWGHASNDINYDLRSTEFRQVFNEIRTRGFELGLHASYNAHGEASRFTAEKERLETFSNGAVTGIRHHFWHTGKNVDAAIEMHEHAGFSYDSSFAFNEHLGFRRSVAFPYYPWLGGLKRASRVRQLPVFCMDGNVFYLPVSPEQALEKIKQFIDPIKLYGGLGIIDWHVRTSYPGNEKYQEWGKTYLGLLEELSSDNEVWVANLGEINSWLNQRRRRLVD